MRSHDRSSTPSFELGVFGDGYTSASLLVFTLRGRNMSQERQICTYLGLFSLRYVLTVCYSYTSQRAMLCFLTSLL